MFLANKLNKGAGVPTPKDAQFNYVTMLLHGDGTNGAQNNTFVDSSSNNYTITRNGNTTQGSFSPYGFNWSNYFDGSGDFLTTSTSQIIPTGSFTVECYVFVTGSGNNQKFVAQGTSGSAGRFSLGIEGGNWWVQLGSDAIQTGTPVRNQWNYVAVTYNGSTITLYVNGTSIGTVSSTANAQNTTLTIGQDWNSYITTGYISNVRVSNVVRTITASTSPYTSDANTRLLTCQSNRFIDTSANAFALTVNGNPSVQRFNPFGTSTAYSTSVIGGSAYFDGSGDYLSTANSSAFAFGTGNFTLEFWYKGTDNSGGLGLVTGGSTGYWQLNLFSSTMYWQDAVGASNLLSVNAIPILNDSWNHVAVVRNSTTSTIYFNGVSVTSATDTTNYSGTGGDFRLGFDSNSNYIAGYIADYRIVKGTAVYTANFTPPTAPLTAVTNTQLLLKTTNGAIFDNAMMNDLETVGNAQISTSVKKYGTGSLYFDGTGDWLIMPYGPTQNFGTGNFTIEGWFYLNSLAASYYVPAGTWGSGTSDEWLIQIQNNGSIRFLTTSGSTFYSASITTATWYHIAVVRSGTTVTIYVNGTSVGSYTCSNSLGSVSKTLYIGSQAGTWDWNGYIDDFRITNGYARYTATFTPPTSALSDTGPY